MKQIVFLILMFSGLTLSAQNKTNRGVLNEEGLLIDSVAYVVYDKETSLYCKYKVVESITDFEKSDLLLPIYSAVLSAAKQQHNDSMQMQLYSRMAGVYLVNNMMLQAESYLDSAFCFEQKVNNAECLFSLYCCASFYYNYVGNSSKSQEYLSKILQRCSVVPQGWIKVSSDLYHLSLAGLKKRNYKLVKKNIDKMAELEKKIKEPSFSLITNTVKAQYYLMHYCTDDYSQMKVSGKSLLDSVEFYAGNAINIFNGENQEPDFVWKDPIGRCYGMLALTESESFKPNQNKIMEYIERSELYTAASSSDSQINNMILKGGVYKHRKEFDLAVDEGNKALKLVHDLIHQNKSVSDRYDLIFAKVYNLLAESYQGINDYEQAYKYKVLENEYLEILFDKKKYQMKNEVEVVKPDKSAQEYSEGKAETKSYNRSYIKYFFICNAILLIGAAGLIIYRIRIKKKIEPDRSEIEEKERKREEEPVKHQEENEKLSELERYEALLELHFKNLERSEKEKEQEKLKRNKEILDARIKSYNEKLKQFEAESEDRRLEHIKKRANPLINEITLLLEKKKIKNKDIYIEKLNRIDDKFIYRLEKVSGSSISTIYIKYSICFVISMEVKEVAECLSVEPSSVHMMKYRLKKKLKLKGNDDLNLFLINLLNDN